MPLRLIIGRSNSGKSQFIYKKIKEEELSGVKNIVFVPDFARIVAEQEYFKYTGNLGMINTKITTINRFSTVSASKYTNSKKLLPDMSKRFILKKCIEDNKDIFKIFSKVKNTQGFVDKLYKMIDVFDMQQLDEDMLKNIYSDGSFLSKKFKEIYDIYSKVSEEIKPRFITAVDQLDLLMLDIRESVEHYNKYTYYFDLYNNFNEKELNIISSLLDAGCNVNITLDLDLECVELTDMFGISFDTYIKLKNMAKDIGCNVVEQNMNFTDKARSMLEYLQKNIFTLGVSKQNEVDGSVEVILYKNPFDEIESIAKDIKFKVDSGKYRYKDFKVYYNNEDMYDLAIRKIFNTYNIPVYISTASKGSGTLGSCVINLVQQVANGFHTSSLDNIIELLKTGLFIEDAADVNMFESYLREFGIKAYNFSREFTKNNSENDSFNFQYDLEKINEIRIKIYDGISLLRDTLLESDKTEDYTKKIYSFLIDNKIIARYECQLNEIKEYDIERYNRKKQVVSHIVEVLDNIDLAFEKVEFSSYVELLKYGIESIELNSIPPFVDQVEICNIDSTRSLPRSQVYIIGVYENGLPVMNNSEGIFTDKEIETLKAMNLDFIKTSETRNNMALFNVYKAVNSCGEHLTFTVPTTKITGESLRPSPIITRIKEIIPIKVDGSITQSQNLPGVNICDIFNKFVKGIKEIDGMSDDEIQELNNQYVLLNQYEKYNKILDYNRVQSVLLQATVDKLYGQNILSSVSRLEKFKECPFNYFLNYVLKLKEKKEYKLSSLDLGSIMHKVLEEFSRFLITKNIGYQEILSSDEMVELAKQSIDNIVEKIFDSMYEKYLSNARYTYLKVRLKKGILNIILALSKSFAQSEFRPFGFEIEFDNGKLFAPIKVELEDGRTMFLRGKIDRVDVAKIKDNIYLRVVDYKSSSKDLKLSDVRDGVALQLMSYMAALIENKESIDNSLKAIPAAVSYFTLNMDLLNLSEYLDEDKISEKLVEKMKMKGIYLNDVEVLHGLDNKFSQTSQSFIDISQRRLSNTEKSLTEQEFLNECKNIKNILSTIGSELKKGIVDTSKTEKSCEYCSYASICRKNILN